MTQASIAEAKNNLPRLVQQAEAGEQICITRRGRPVAVILSTEAYARLSAPKLTLGEFLRSWREEMQVGLTPFADDAMFNNLRDPSQGREVTFP
jgi:prevent-host-death family protein